jgi:hypothetical protein
VENVLKGNGYPKRMIDEVRMKSQMQAQRTEGDRNTDQNQIRIKFPYVKGVSEKIRRICGTYGITPAFKGGPTLRNRLTRVKGHIQFLDRKDVVYGIPCGECDEVYKGETSQPLKKRIAQHKGYIRKSEENSALFKHVQRTGHAIDWDSTWIIDRESYEGRRLTKEGIAIKFGQNFMEHNVGRDVSEVWRTLASKIGPMNRRTQ